LAAAVAVVAAAADGAAADFMGAAVVAFTAVAVGGRAAVADITRLRSARRARRRVLPAGFQTSAGPAAVLALAERAALVPVARAAAGRTSRGVLAEAVQAPRGPVAVARESRDLVVAARALRGLVVESPAAARDQAAAESVPAAAIARALEIARGSKIGPPAAIARTSPIGRGSTTGLRAAIARTSPIGRTDLTIGRATATGSTTILTTTTSTTSRTISIGSITTVGTMATGTITGITAGSTIRGPGGARG